MWVLVPKVVRSVKAITEPSLPVRFATAPGAKIVPALVIPAPLDNEPPKNEEVSEVMWKKADLFKPASATERLDVISFTSLACL